MLTTVDCGLVCGVDSRVIPRAEQGNKGSATLLRATRKPRFPLSTTCTDLDELNEIRHRTWRGPFTMCTFFYKNKSLWPWILGCKDTFGLSKFRFVQQLCRKVRTG
jgi:hypothetical protein